MWETDRLPESYRKVCFTETRRRVLLGGREGATETFSEITAGKHLLDSKTWWSVLRI